MSSAYRASAILLLSFGLSLALATPVPQATGTSTGSTSSTTMATQSQGPSPAEMETLLIMTPPGSQCFLLTNEQLYPLGLRAGLYLQWFATIFANFFVP